VGGPGADTLTAGSSTDSLVGGGGDDVFQFGPAQQANDTVVEAAGTGNAELDFSGLDNPVSVNLSQGGTQAVVPGALSLTLPDPMGFADVIGSPFNDTIIGNARDNVLIGGGGDDVVAGLGGNDVLQGNRTQVVFLDFDSLTIPGEHIYTPAERDAIQAGLTADYSAFSFQFTQTIPASGPYSTIFFNDPGLTGLEGGIVGHIDWRNLDPNDIAAVNVNGLLGRAGQPAATSADFVAMSVTVAAHELGHLQGLQHGDAYGPIGAGIYKGVAPNLYLPAYPGPVVASETVNHIMASGASVHSSLFDAINNPFFGEREDIKLAFDDHGSAVNEQAAAHASTATAQPITLAPLAVPNTVRAGVNADRVFNVHAADVIGSDRPRPGRERAGRLLRVHGQRGRSDQPRRPVARPRRGARRAVRDQLARHGPPRL
jgi:hypothetical protein